MRDSDTIRDEPFCDSHGDTMRDGGRDGASLGWGGRRRGARRGAPDSGSGPPGNDGPTPGSSADLAAEADPESVARTLCLRQLTQGPRTRAQLEAMLRKRGVPQDAGERVLDRLAGVGLIDDAAFADLFVRSQRTNRGLGSRGLAQELRRRGVADDLVVETLSEIDADDEMAAAKTLVTRRLRSMHGLSREAKVRRLSGMLARKGYPPGLAMRVIRDALDDDIDDSFEDAVDDGVDD